MNEATLGSLCVNCAATARRHLVCGNADTANAYVAYCRGGHKSDRPSDVRVDHIAFRAEQQKRSVVSEPTPPQFRRRR